MSLIEANGKFVTEGDVCYTCSNDFIPPPRADPQDGGYRPGVEQTFGDTETAIHFNCLVSTLKSFVGHLFISQGGGTKKPSRIAPRASDITDHWPSRRKRRGGEQARLPLQGIFPGVLLHSMLCLYTYALPGAFANFPAKQEQVIHPHSQPSRRAAVRFPHLPSS